MPKIFTSTMIFSNDQSTSNDRLKPVMTTGLVNMHIDRSIANLAPKGLFFSLAKDADQLAFSLKML